MKKIQHILLAAGLLAATSVSADLINIDTVKVGHVNNENDDTNYGQVSYVYSIGTYEVTNSQYAAFLNKKAATDTHSLYNPEMNSSEHGGINRSGLSGSYSYDLKEGMDNKPVNFVSFWDAARFANWLTNGQGNGDTENGVYDLTNNVPTRNLEAWKNGGWAIASENEWYKAAYYDGDEDRYFDYATQSDIAPTPELPAGGNNSANYLDINEGSPMLTDVGAYVDSGSSYGTFDQGGNVWEWNEAIIYVGDTPQRGLRGGAAHYTSNDMRSSYRDKNISTLEGPALGFRVSYFEAVPEPSAYASILGCLALALALTRRKGCA